MGGVREGAAHGTSVNEKPTMARIAPGLSVNGALENS